jgi:hypothetical protein
MPRSSSDPPRLRDVKAMVQQCDELIESMKVDQKNYNLAESVPVARKAQRLFREHHYAFVNAGYTVGDYLTRLVVRQFKTAEVDAHLSSPLPRFYRVLRDGLDHGGPLRFKLSYEVELNGEISVPKTFPSLDLLAAIQRGVAENIAKVTTSPHLFSYGREHFEPEVAVLFDGARISRGLPPNESVVVIYFCELYVNGLRELLGKAEREGRLRPSAA